VRFVIAFLALAIVAGAGIVHALWTDRWSLSGEPAASAARLSQVPETVGDWEGKTEAIDPRQLAITRAAGSLARRYIHPATKKELYVMILCGRPGPISVHTPQVCYTGAGYKMDTREEQVQIDCGEDVPQATFFTAIFSKTSGRATSRLQIFWAWNPSGTDSATGAWQVANEPRVAFGHFPALYKMYIVRELGDLDKTDDGLGVEFLQSLLPELQQALFPSARVTQRPAWQAYALRSEAR
jgi:hypothetical protein